MPEFWDPISGPIFPNKGDQEKFWKMTRRFIEDLAKASGAKTVRAVRRRGVQLWQGGGVVAVGRGGGGGHGSGRGVGVQDSACDEAGGQMGGGAHCAGRSGSDRARQGAGNGAHGRGPEAHLGSG